MRTGYSVLYILLFIARDMFIGLILGTSVAVVLADMNPAAGGLVAILMPIGALTGILKGSVKYIISKMFNGLPDYDYDRHYPKYRILVFWLGILIAALVYSYGLNPSSWVYQPWVLVKTNIVFNRLNTPLLYVSAIMAFMTGLLSFFWKVSAPSNASNLDDKE